MIGARWLALLALLVVTAGAPAQNIPVTGQAVAGLEAFDQAVLQLMQKYQIPGAALAVVRDGRLILARGYGYADRDLGVQVQPDSLFRIASISKPLTAAAILKLIEQGKITLGTRAFQYLSHLQGPAGSVRDARLDSITIEHLLKHEGGWDRDGTGYDPMFDVVRAAQALGVPPPATCEVVIRYMLGRRLDFDPGARYSYSNFGYCVLGRIIEKASGTTYEAYVRQNILQPAGATRARLGRTLLEERFPSEVVHYSYPGQSLASSVFPPHAPAPAPYGGFYMAAHDANGGWIATTVDLLRYLTSMNGSRQPALLVSPPPGFVGFVPPVGTGWGWLFNGSLPGNNGTLRLDSRTAWCFLTNMRPAPSITTFFTESDTVLVAAARQVSNWPGTDRFSEFARAEGPVFTAAWITNGASFRTGLAPGGIATVFGLGLADAVSGVLLASSLPLPRELGGVSVTINGLPAPLFAIANVGGQQQINFQIPFELAGQQTANVVVQSGGVSSAPVQASLRSAHPGVFTVDGTAGAILHADYGLVSASRPAAPGEIVIVYGTGFGPVSPPAASGAPAGSAPLSQLTLVPSVTIGGLPAEVHFAGLAPGFAGLYQLNVRVPGGLAAGTHDLTVTVAGNSSEPVKIAVR